MHQRGRRSHVGHTYGHDITIYSLLRLVRPCSDRLQLVWPVTPQAALYSTLGTLYALARSSVTHTVTILPYTACYDSFGLVQIGYSSFGLLHLRRPRTNRLSLRRP